MNSLAKRLVATMGFDKRSALILVVLVGVAMLLQPTGEVVADARYEQLGDPGQFLTRHSSIWDDERTIGQPTRYFAPVLGLFNTVATLVLRQAWIVQRALHAALFILSGIGAIKLARELFGNRTVELVAGLAYVFNPFTTQYLLPSGLFGAYVAAPWFALGAYRGVRLVQARTETSDGAPGETGEAGGSADTVRAKLGSQSSPWRGAATFALAFFALGLINTASLVQALLPAGAIVIASWLGGAATLRSVWDWSWRAGLLTLLVSGPTLLVLSLSSLHVRANLETTETPEAVGNYSSASETWRGLGQWLSYLRIDDAALREQSVGYFSNPIIIICSFVLMALAAIGLARGRNPLIAALGVLSALSVAIMVGIHPVGEASPFGSALARGMSESLFIRGFRSTYKAGPSLMLALALLAGIGVTVLMRVASSKADSSEESRLIRTGLGAVVALAMAIAAFPFWTGLYPDTVRFSEIPDYWEETFEWFEEQPSDEAVLVLPSLARTTYRWGFVNDTLFDAHLRQPMVGARSLPQSTAQLADLTEAIDAQFSADPTRGTLGPILRRLGVRWILVQNDMDWRTADVARPQAFDAIRSDPEFVRVAQFGESGENIIGPVALGPIAVAESELAPVEVFELRNRKPVGASVSSQPLVVMGAGDSWMSLAASQLLQAPVVYGAEMTPSEISAQNPVAIALTDGSQRRAGRVIRSQLRQSHILSATEDPGRPPQTLFDDIEDQSVVEYRDAVVIDDNNTRSLWRNRTSMRPAFAFDGNPHTAWGVDPSRGGTLRLNLKEPTKIESVKIEMFTDRTGQPTTVKDVIVNFNGDTSSQPFVAEVADNYTEIPQSAMPDAVESLWFGLDPSWSSRQIGIQDITIETADGPLDLTEYVRTPGPATEAEADEWASAFEGTPVVHSFRRPSGPGGFLDAAEIEREFWSPAGEVELEATMKVDELTPDATIRHLVGALTSATAESRFNGWLGGIATNVLDDRIDTAWAFDSQALPSLEISTPDLLADTLEMSLVVQADASRARSRLSDFDVTILDSAGATETQSISLGPLPTCVDSLASADADLCVERVSVAFEPRLVTSIKIEPTAVIDASSGLDPRAVQIAIARLELDGDPVLDDGSLNPTDDCREMFEIDGVAISMRPWIPPTLDALQDGVRYVSCGPVALDQGWHRFGTVSQASHSALDVLIKPTGFERTPVETSPVEVLDASSSKRVLRADVEAGDIVVTDLPEHPGWRLSVDGVAGQRSTADGFAAWQATESGSVTLSFRFAPQRWYTLALLVSIVTLAACVWLLFRDPNARLQSAATALPGWRDSLFHDEQVQDLGERSDMDRNAALGVGAAFALFGWLISGFVGLVFGILVAALAWVSPRILRWCLLASPGVVAAFTIFEGSLNPLRLSSFVSDRSLSHSVGFIVVLIWIAAALTSGVFDRDRERLGAITKEATTKKAPQAPAPIETTLP